MSSTWIGGLRNVLARAETSHAPRPEGENVVTIPNGLDKLRRAIVSVQAEMVEAQTQRATYREAWKLCQAEMQAAFASNTQRQRDAAHRLKRLQEEWVRASQDLGIRSEIVHAPLDDTGPWEPDPAECSSAE